MAVVKISGSGKQVQFIDDQGRVFATSAVFMQGLLMGKAKSGFVLLSRMPWNVPPEKFKDSPIYDPDGKYTGDAAKTLEPATFDPMSKKSVEQNKRKKAFKDKMVWSD